MSGKVKIIDRLLGLLTAVKAKDQAALDKVLTEDDDEPMGETFGSMDAFKKEVKDWMDGMDARMKDAFEKKEEPKKEEKKEEKEEKTEDTIISAETLGKTPDMLGRTWTGDSVAPFVKEIISRAEILSPGITVPTADVVSQVGLKQFMLTALSRASTTDAGKDCIKPFLSPGQTLDTLDGRALTLVFNGAAEVQRVKNNATFRPTAVKTADFGKPVSVEDIQKLNNDFWANGGKQKVGGK